MSLACPFSSNVSFVNTEYMNRCLLLHLGRPATGPKESSPPGGGFLFGRLPKKEPRGRGPPSKRLNSSTTFWHIKITQKKTEFYSTTSTIQPKKFVTGFPLTCSRKDPENLMKRCVPILSFPFLDPVRISPPPWWGPLPNVTSLNKKKSQICPFFFVKKYSWRYFLIL